MKILRFNPDHALRCMEIFRSNLGQYFDQSESELFEAFLKNEKLTKNFYVIQDGELVVGCGGFEETGPRQYDLDWGMIHRDYHRQGFGDRLLRFRMDRIEEIHGKAAIRIETSQHTEGFYRRYGFASSTRKPDGFGPGIDYVLMIRDGEQVAAGNDTGCARSSPAL